MKFIRFLHLIPIILALSCTPIVKEIYQVGKATNFTSLEQYKIAAQNKYKIDTSNFYYTSKDDYSSLISLLQQRKTVYFYGIFLNDSTRLMSSNFLQENENCRGRIVSEIENATTDLTHDDIFKKVKFINISTGQQPQLNQSNKKKLVLIFGHTQGLLLKKDFVELQKMIRQRSDYELYILSLDPVYYYQEVSKR